MTHANGREFNKWPSAETGRVQLQLFQLIDLMPAVWGKSVKCKEMCVEVSTCQNEYIGILINI